eukprot:scaffold281197_cov33-Tisochrysis_lutea.AAC.5
MYGLVQPITCTRRSAALAKLLGTLLRTGEPTFTVSSCIKALAEGEEVILGISTASSATARAHWRRYGSHAWERIRRSSVWLNRGGRPRLPTLMVSASMAPEGSGLT